MDFFTGVIVTPASPPTGTNGIREVIVGLIINTYHDYVQVVWFSDQRGIFVCDELRGDLVPASLVDRGRMEDIKLDHYILANLLHTEATRATL